MRRHCAWLWIAALSFAPGVACAQQATTVQLPTYSFFTVRTTVSVPDRGSAYLGGVKRAATGSTRLGAPLLPFGNRSTGIERSASGARASVFIHDFEAMDEHLLSQPTSPRFGQPVPRPAGPAVAGVQSGPARPAAASAANDVWQNRLSAATQGSAGPVAKSVAQLRAEHRREQEAVQEEAAMWFERGRKAEAAGKATVARVCYQSAARRATGPLKEEVAARLAAVNGSSSAVQVAERRPSGNPAP